jgi:hypothetical protein
MRISGAYKVMALVAVLIIAAGAAMITAGEAGAAPGHVPYPVLRINQSIGQVTLRIPTPACSGGGTSCVWMLFVNEPKTGTVVGSVTGTSGVLTIDFPDFCGGIQADALIGPAPWVQKAGTRRHIDNCGGSTTTTTEGNGGGSTTTTTEGGGGGSTTTTTTEGGGGGSTTTTTQGGGNGGSTTTTDPSSTTTTLSGGGTTTTIPGTQQAGGGGTQGTGSSTTSSTSGLPYGYGSSSGSGGGGSGSNDTLPFTGGNLQPLVILGTILVLLGGVLLSNVERRRRVVLRAARVDTGQVRDGVRKASSWFLGL